MKFHYELEERYLKYNKKIRTRRIYRSRNAKNGEEELQHELETVQTRRLYLCKRFNTNSEITDCSPLIIE
jgi:hypothetical protein